MSVTTSDSNAGLLNFIERASRDPEFDVRKFGELLQMQREVTQEQERREFNRAMAAAQAEMLPVIRDAKNTHIGNRYARLETIDAAMRPIYTRHGFSVRYGSAPPLREDTIRLVCTVAHAGGYFEENYLDAPLSTTGSQGGRTATTAVQSVGSTVTYLRRYLLGMVFNIVLADDDDDDGEASRTGRQQARTETRRADPRNYSDEQWHSWLDKLKQSCAVLRSREELEQAASRGTVGDAIAGGPEWVQREISLILAENYARFELKPDDLPDVEIAGEHKLASG
jgi:hypothetical protein